MSIEAVNQFLQKVAQDPQLQQELAKVLEVGNDQQAVTDLAVKHGYQFTADEFRAEIQNHQSKFQQTQAAGELNQEELEAVAGGFVGGGGKFAMKTEPKVRDQKALTNGLNLGEDKLGK